MQQSKLYKRTHNVDYLGDFPGADPLDNLVRTALTDAVEVSSLPEPVQTQVAAALASDGSDSLLVDSNSPLDVSAATVPVEEDTPLDVSAATVPVAHQGVIDVSSRDGRNLGDVDVTTLPNADSDSWNGATLSANSFLSLPLSAIGADRLRGKVWSDNSYNVSVVWKNAAGNMIESIDHATGVTGGTKTSIDLQAYLPQAEVRIVEMSGTDSTANGGVMLA